MGFTNGIVCQNSGMPRFQPRTDSFKNRWDGNIRAGFPGPELLDATGLQKIMAGGGGDAGCSAACQCSQDNPTCACPADSNCGYPKINDTCVQPVVNGTYRSLKECQSS